MTTHADLPASTEPRAPLRGLTRALASLHALLGAGALVLAALAFVEYGAAGPDETFAGLLVLLGLALVALGAVLLVLGSAAALARRPSTTYGLGLATGLVGLGAAASTGWWLASWPPAALGVGGLGLALAACSLVGLAAPRS